MEEKIKSIVEILKGVCYKDAEDILWDAGKIIKVKAIVK